MLALYLFKLEIKTQSIKFIHNKMESESKEFFKGQYVDAQDNRNIWRPA